MGAAHDDTERPGSTDAGDSDDHATRRPGVDLTGALGVAGHEVELLHAEDVADTAPVIGAPATGNDLDLDVAAGPALRGMDAGLFEPGDADH